MKKRKNLYGGTALFLLAAIIMVFFTGCELLEERLGHVVPGAESSAEEEVREEITDPNLFALDTMMDDIDISGMTRKEAAEACRAAVRERYAGVKVTVQLDENTSVELTNEDLTIADTLDFSLNGILKDRDGSQNKISYSLKLRGLETYLEEMAAKVNVAGQDAEIDYFDTEKAELVFKEGVNGLTLDQDATVKKAIELFKGQQSGTVEAVFVSTPAAVTTEQIKEQFALISEFSTVSTNTENGNHNMALALSKVNGSLVNPGEIFSFEEKVGNSTTAESGFKPANGLMNGILTPMYGGGICQASTTVYGAVLRADMTIVEREAHSVPSSYIKIGQDAAVSYRQLDFKFQNDLETPIYLAAWMADKTLYVRVYGTKSTEWDSIEVYSQQTGTLKRLDKITYQVDNSLKKGEYKLVTEGNVGYTATAWRDYIKDGEVIKTEALKSSRYRPTGPTYKIGPGTDKAEIPAPGTTPTPEPSPTPEPTEEPSAEPTVKPTKEPEEKPTAKPTKEPEEEPTAKPTKEPAEKPTEKPEAKPTEAPTAEPTEAPTAEPTEAPTAEPTAAPTAEPTEAPTAEPTAAPTAEPTEAPAPEQTEPAGDAADGE